MTTGGNPVSVSPRFARLLEPGSIGQMTVRNRMVMPPMGTFLSSKEGYVTQRNKDHYMARARAGIGLVIVEITCVDAPEGKGYENMLVADDDKYIPGLNELAENIKRHGARAAIQLHHIGAQGQSSITGMQPVAPSPILLRGGEMPRQLTETEIGRLVKCFAQAARRAKEAGFEGVEVHGAHMYLISQFLSASTNQRQDRYGGTVENRARFLIEILKAVREQVGREYPVWCRLNGIELGVKDGVTIEDTIQVARMAEEAGADAIHLSAMGGGGPLHPEAQQSGLLDTTLQRWMLEVRESGRMLWDTEPGVLLPLAEAVKKVVSIPVIAVAHMDPLVGETALQQGKADFIAFGRPLLADPEIPGKVASDRLDEIRPCLFCNTCLDTLLRTPGEDIQCAVNPAMGREQEHSITRAERIRKVFVVGGGPAGMEAARVAALRGHKVQLYENGQELGGQLLLAQVAPYKQRIGELARYLSDQMGRQGVEVHLATEVTADLIAEKAPDAVILATGASPFMPGIPGLDRENVVMAVDVLTGRAKVGARVAIIGGELVGCEVADFLADAGRKVTLIRRGAELALKVNLTTREQLLYRLAVKEVTIMTEIEYREITGDGVAIIDKNGKEQTIKADTVVLATGTRPNTELLHILEGRVSEVYPVGDCVEPRNILESMKEGYRAGLSV